MYFHRDDIDTPFSFFNINLKHEVNLFFRLSSLFSTFPLFSKCSLEHQNLNFICKAPLYPSPPSFPWPDPIASLHSPICPFSSHVFLLHIFGVPGKTIVNGGIIRFYRGIELHQNIVAISVREAQHLFAAQTGHFTSRVPTPRNNSSFFSVFPECQLATNTLIVTCSFSERL